MFSVIREGRLMEAYETEAWALHCAKRLARSMDDCCIPVSVQVRRGAKLIAVFAAVTESDRLWNRELSTAKNWGRFQRKET